MVAIISNIRSAPNVTMQTPIPPPSLPPATPAALGRAHLSRREQEILPLLAARWSDREIADALCISYRTATTHVTHIFNKFGINSRRDLASAMR